MILKYSYWYFKSAIPGHICNQIIEMGLTNMHEQEEKYGKHVSEATVGGWVQKNETLSTPVNSNSIRGLQKMGVDLKTTYVRDSNVTFLNEKSLYELIHPFVTEANKQAGWNFDWDYTENLQFTKYGPGQFYGWHADEGGAPYELFNPTVDEVHKDADGNTVLDMFGNPMIKDMRKTNNDRQVGKIRKLSVTISLNDPKEYTGGNLRFDLGTHRTDRYHLCTEIRPQGSIIVFPSHIQHQVTPVKTGTRYSLVAWNLGAPFR